MMIDTRTPPARPRRHTGRPGAALRAALSRFAREEDGNLIIMGVYVFVLILMLGGIGIDLMRFERDRAKLQYTLDRAALAAADLDQTLDPVDVVYDYLNKAGLGDKITSVVVDEGLGYRTVTVDASAAIETQFMHMNGLEELIAPATSTAEERIGGVEISLVLDVSGSMNSNSRLANLKIAAKDFIDQMVDNSEEGKLSISIIPYATQVALPNSMFERLNVSLSDHYTISTSDTMTTGELDSLLGNSHKYSNCINFEASDFNTTAFNMSEVHQQTMHFDPWYDWDGRDNDPMELVGADSYHNSTLPVCEAREVPHASMPASYHAGLPSRAIMPLSNDTEALKTYIDNLRGRGNTSIDIGMKWGAAMVDPSMQPMVNALIASGDVPADFDGRPYAYEAGETLKVIVLMTDGRNTSQYYIEDAYRTGLSNIWWNEEQEIYSVYVGLDEGDYNDNGITDEPMFYWPYDGSWQNHPYGNGEFEEEVETTEYVCRSYKRDGSCKRYKKKTITEIVMVDEPGTAVEVSYADLYAYTTMEWIVEDLYEPWMYDSQAWDDWYYDVRSYVGSTTKDNRTKAICDAVKAQNVIVFSVGFEAPSSGLAVLEDCASSASHFFDVEGLEIASAFSAIASSIRQLRLTQ